MRPHQFLAALLALGATLVASLGTHALHWLAPHSHSGHSRSLSALSSLTAPGCGCFHVCHGARKTASTAAGAALTSRELLIRQQATRLVANPGLNDLSQGTSDLEASIETPLEPPLEPSLEPSFEPSADASCAICRHLRQFTPVATSAAEASQPHPVALLTGDYAPPRGLLALIGWHSRGPPLSC